MPAKKEAHPSEAHPNPELQPGPHAEFAPIADADGNLVDPMAGGTVYKVPEGHAVPPLTVEVLPAPGGGENHIKVPEGDEHAEPGDYFAGDQLVLDGPTAHMLEARGAVKVVGFA